MAKVQIKSEKVTPFGGIFHVRDQFSRFVGPVTRSGGFVIRLHLIFGFVIHIRSGGWDIRFRSET